MIPIVALVIDTSNDNWNYLHTIEFDMDGGQMFCYRSRMSYEAFTNVLKKRNVNKRAKLRYVCKCKVEYDNDVRVWQGTMARNPGIADLYNIPTVKVNSLWEFYNYIGYNYKSKTYMEQ